MKCCPKCQGTTGYKFALTVERTMTADGWDSEPACLDGDRTTISNCSCIDCGTQIKESTIKAYDDLRTCGRCGESKTHDQFYRNHGHGLHSMCKKCNHALKVKYREDHPHRYLARTKARNAIASGVLVRQPCEVCGDSPVQAHHDDYRLPLAVRWLCRPHHVEWHKHNKAKE